MLREVLQGKIHQATVTEANVHYVGSITIDRDLIDRAGFWVGQKVLVVSNTTGTRLETYVIEAERESGVVGINGAAAHLIGKGETVIIMGFALSETPLEPRVVLVDANNRFSRALHETHGLRVDPAPL
jgi:aspartate 1-decarboxylase